MGAVGTVLKTLHYGSIRTYLYYLLELLAVTAPLASILGRGFVFCRMIMDVISHYVVTQHNPS